MPFEKIKKEPQPEVDELESMKRTVEAKDAVRVQAAKQALLGEGVDSFILLYHPQPGVNMFHTEHCKLDDTVGLLVMGLRNTIDNIKQNPSFSKEYKQLFVDLLGDINGAIMNHNKRFQKFSDDGGKVAK